MSMFRRRRNFRLTVDGEVRGNFSTYETALSAVPGDYERRWSVDEWVVSRYFNKAVGWKSGTTSADLARLGMPIGQQSLSEERL